LWLTLSKAPLISPSIAVVIPWFSRSILFIASSVLLNGRKPKFTSYSWNMGSYMAFRMFLIMSCKILSLKLGILIGLRVVLPGFGTYILLLVSLIERRFFIPSSSGGG